MTGTEDPIGGRAVHLASVQAWRAELPGDGGPQHAVVLALAADDVELPPIVVPIEAVAGLVSVLLRAAGLDLDLPSSDPSDGHGITVGASAWARLLGVERTPVVALDRSTVPSGPGVYAWFRGGAPIHLARAVGKRGLRAAIGGDALRGDVDRSRRAFRAEVAGHLGLAAGPRGGEAPLDPADVGVLDAWIAGCEVAWLACSTPAEAAELEHALRAEHDPAPRVG